MSLLAIKTYLQQKKVANLEQIATSIHSTPEAVRPMLAHWIRKEKVLRIDNPVGCGSSCTQCSTDNRETYMWLFSGMKPATVETVTDSTCRE